MRFILQRFEGIPLITTDDFFFENVPLEEYPSYCGAGKGIGDLIVPETVWGLRIAVACHTHDDFWAKSEKSDRDYFLSNGIFLLNTLMVICNRSNLFLIMPRSYRAIKYFYAVNSIGKKYFKRGI